MSAVLFESRSVGSTGWLMFTGSVLCVPLAFAMPDHIPPWLAFRAEALTFAGLAIMLLGMYAGRQRGRMHTLTLLIAALSILPWLQWIAGVHPYVGDALLSWFYLMAAAMALHLGATIASKEKQNKILNTAMALLAIGAAISAAVSIVQWFGLYSSALIVDATPGGRALGNLAQPNHLATVCLTGVVATAWLYKRGIIGRSGFLTALLIITIGVVLSQSRTGLLSATCLIIVSLFLRKRTPLEFDVRAITGWLLALGLAWASAPLLAKALQIGQGRELSIETNGRWQIWLQVFEGILQRPYLGYGWNQTTASHMAGASADTLLHGVTVTHAHNVILDLMAWVGIPLASILLAGCFYWGWTRSRGLRTPEAAFALLTLVPVAIHSLLEFPFAYAYFLIPAAVAAGVIEAHYSQARYSIPTGPSLSLYLIWVGLGLGIAVEYSVIESEYREVRFAAAKIGRPSTADSYETIVLNTHMRSMIKAAKTQIRSDMRSDELANLQLVCNRFPYSSLTLRCALAFALNGQPEHAAATMERYRHLYGATAYDAAISAYANQLQIVSSVAASPK